jgi:N-acetylneuraminate lyase
LSLADRKQVAERVVNANAGRVPVIVHVGCISTSDAVKLARHASEVGADAISSVPPIFYPCTPEGLFEHYRRIGGETDLPFYPYHHFMFGESMLADPEYPERLLSLPNIAGMKITVRDLFLFGILQRHTHGRLNLFSGADELMCHAAVSGAIGAIGTFYNLFGPTCQAVRKAFVAGDFARGKAFMAVFQGTIDRLLRSGGIYAFLRTAMKLKYEIEIGPGVAPSSYGTISWKDDEVRAVIQEVEEAGRGA